jgi:hypothetical protein
MSDPAPAIKPATTTTQYTTNSGSRVAWPHARHWLLGSETDRGVNAT